MYTAAIVGAGIGGLSLACALARRGGQCVVLEARTEAATATEGVFLTLAPNGMNGLRAIGCFDEVRARGIDTNGIEIRNAKGRRLALIAQDDHEREFGAPSVTIGRGPLVEILVRRARALGVDLRFGESVAELDWSHDADMLVAADGLRSTVRRLVFPDYPEPRFTGLIGTGGITTAPVPDTGGVMRMTFGDKAFFGYLKAAGQPVYWFDSYAAAQPEAVPDPAAYARAIAALHAADPAPNAEILAHVDTLGRNYPIYDLPALPAWHRGSVVLVGDAAHAVGPHAGQGASMAIEDALVLAACLEDDRDQATAFARYEALRRPRIEEVVRITRHNASQKRASGRLALLIRDLILPLAIPIGARRARGLMRYRADRTPLLPPFSRQDRPAARQRAPARGPTSPRNSRP